jgi:hypothetical protein
MASPIRGSALYEGVSPTYERDPIGNGNALLQGVWHRSGCRSAILRKFWDKLYYCYRDDVVFSGGYFAPSSRMLEFLSEECGALTECPLVRVATGYV